jgi:hypothetical protein
VSQVLIWDDALIVIYERVLSRLLWKAGLVQCHRGRYFEEGVWNVLHYVLFYPPETYPLCLWFAEFLVPQTSPFTNFIAA